MKVQKIQQIKKKKKHYWGSKNIENQELFSKRLYIAYNTIEVKGEKMS